MPPVLDAHLGGRASGTAARSHLAAILSLAKNRPALRVFAVFLRGLGYQVSVLLHRLLNIVQLSLS
jgi:hypothetical protein